MARGDYEQLEGNWIHTSAVAALAGKLFAVDSARLWAIDVEAGTWEEMPGTWDSKALAPCGVDALFAFEQSGALYRVSVGDGTWEELPGSYLHLGDACGGGDGDGAVYAVEGPALWKIERDGAYAKLGDGTWDTRKMVGVGGALVMFERSGELYRASCATGAWSQLPGVWLHTQAACVLGGKVYAVDNEILYELDPATGASEQINEGWRTRHLGAVGRSLYAFEESGSLFRIDVE